MADLMPMVHAERRSLAGFLDTLPEDQWAAASWCDKWNVQQVVGHVVAAGNVTVPHFFAGLIRSGFSFDRFVEGDLEKYAAGSPADTLARFQEIIESDRTPPAPDSKYIALGEVMVHGEDIRRALGDPGDHPAEHLVTLAEFYKGTGPPLRGKKRLAGLRLEATDVDWSTGEGQLVRGPCMALILAMVGRTAALAECEGDGVAVLRSRG
jgi:uncharacterized protein (TIGR03083 family)